MYAQATCVVDAVPARTFAIAAAADRFPPLPPPLEFVKNDSIVQADGTPMHVAHLESGPYFLGERQLQQVSEWLDYPTCRGYRYNEALMLSGPLACGKTTLMKLLPRLLAARCKQAEAAGNSSRPPVLFEFTCPPGAGPKAVALALERALLRRAKELGLSVFDPSYVGRSEEVSLSTLSRGLQEFAKRVHEAGGEPIFLLDEVQVRDSVSSSSDSDWLCGFATSSALLSSSSRCQSFYSCLLMPVCRRL